MGIWSEEDWDPISKIRNGVFCLADQLPAPSPLRGEGRGEGEEISMDHIEKAEEIRQKFFDFSHSKTTEIYTKVSTKSLGKIMSPLDTLELSKGGDE